MTFCLEQDEIGVAVLGRFKAGKSSFLNDFLGRGILPVGVPVTAVVTEIRYGAREQGTSSSQGWTLAGDSARSDRRLHL